MPDPRFERHQDMPWTDCFFLESGWFWKVKLKQYTTGKFYLVDGAGLVAASNNPLVVPNSDAVFKGKTGQEAKRLVEFYGLTKGTALIDFRPSETAPPALTMQVEVLEASGHRPSWVAFSDKSAAINAPDLPALYQLDSTSKAPTSPPESLFDAVPSGTKHVALNCHGQMNYGSVQGMTLFVAGNVTQSNCAAVFQKLKAKSGGGVVWIGGCEAGSDNEFCKQAALASGWYIVAPMITLPIVRPPVGKIDWFAESKVKVFDNKTGKPIAATSFLLLQKDLKFQIVPS